jgi:hypothetical protein
MTKEAVKEFLVQELGFVHLETNEIIKNFGKLIWDVYDYEAWIEPSSPRKPFQSFYTEGMELLMEIPRSGFYTEVYRIVRRDLYLVHISTGSYHKYFQIVVYDRQTLEDIAQIEVSEGYLFIGSQSDLEDVLLELIKVLDTPVRLC